MTLNLQQGEGARLGGDEPLISIGEASLDRMPALTLIFEETAANFTRALEEFTNIPVALSLEDLDAKRVGDLQQHCEGLSTILVYDANGLSAKFAVAVDSGFRDMAVEMLLGSGVVERSDKADRAASRVEARLVNFAVNRLLNRLAAALAPVAEVQFEQDMLASEAGYGAVGQRGAVAIACRFRLKSLEHEGLVAIVLPRAALDPYRTALSRFPGAEGVARDERWSENLYDNIVRTEVAVNVKIEARGFTLEDIANLEVGDVLRLPIAPTSPIRIESEGRTLFWCTLGQKDGHYTVRLEDFSDERQSFIENILGV